MHDDLPARSIQALQQANSIISEITANLNSQEQALPPPPREDNLNAGNSFRVASYGGRQTHFDNTGGPGPKTISKITTWAHHHIGATCTHSTPNPTIIEANTEIDNHADTCCLGANFLPLFFTGKICDISPFLESMPFAMDIEICSGATAYDDPNGNTIILIINEALWMGNQMQHSLLNPYQIRANGVSLCDDPTNTDQYFGIETDGTQIAFKMQGTTCIF